MYSHVTIGSNDIARARAFYDPVLATIGIARFFETERALGFGEMRGTRLWVMAPFDGTPASVGNGMHVAFIAPTRAAVRAFHETALAHGGVASSPTQGMVPVTDPPRVPIGRLEHDPEKWEHFFGKYLAKTRD